MAHTTDLYFTLCKFIREHQIPPKDVRGVLLANGFTKQRVSEMLKVCNVSSATWSSYEKRFIGFKVALETERQKSPNNSRIAWAKFYTSIGRTFRKYPTDFQLYHEGDALCIVVDSRFKDRPKGKGELNRKVVKREGYEVVITKIDDKKAATKKPKRTPPVAKKKVKK